MKTQSRVFLFNHIEYAIISVSTILDVEDKASVTNRMTHSNAFASLGEGESTLLAEFCA
jgi:hypothetical protein